MLFLPTLVGEIRGSYPGFDLNSTNYINPQLYLSLANCIDLTCQEQPAISNNSITSYKHGVRR
jgi:hypothetical protein